MIWVQISFQIFFDKYMSSLTNNHYSDIIPKGYNALSTGSSLHIVLDTNISIFPNQIKSPLRLKHKGL